MQIGDRSIAFRGRAGEIPPAIVFYSPRRTLEVRFGHWRWSPLGSKIVRFGPLEFITRRSFRTGG